MSEERWSRERALAIFGLTEDELAAMEASDGYEAARAAAAAERGEFERYVRERMSEGLRQSRLLNGDGLGEPMGIEEFLQIDDEAS